MLKSLTEWRDIISFLLINLKFFDQGTQMWPNMSTCHSGYSREGIIYYRVKNAKHNNKVRESFLFTVGIDWL